MRDPYFPFHALGFRSNPFRALTDEEWAAIVVLPEAVLEAASSGSHLQVLGEVGRGKTSALLGLAEHFRHAVRIVAYEYLPIGQDTFKSPLAGLQVFLLDEVQRLRPDERRRLLAAARGGLRLILGSHEDLTPLFTGAGLSLSAVRLKTAGRAHLESLLARRLDYFAIPNGQPAITLDPSAVPYLEAAFGMNLRAMERFLYEVFQRLEAPGVLTGERLKALAASLVTSCPFRP
jgi:hypothetical protein